MTAELHTVHVRVNDAATGKPTPCRIRLTDAAGNYYPPLGRLANFATGRGQDVGGNLLLGAKEYAYIDGTGEVPLPAGTIYAELCKGLEYRPQTVEVTLPAGKLALRLSIERWTNLREQGWYSGDTRCHYLSPHAALLEAAAEDLAVVNVLAFEDRIQDQSGKTVAARPNILDFSGQEPAAELSGHLVAVNTHNTHPVLGSLGLLNTHRVVFPLAFGGPDGADDWTLRDWCGQCHRKGGLVAWTRPWYGYEAASPPPGEALADLVLGEIDAFEMERQEDFGEPLEWSNLLNSGFRVPVVGASGKASNGVALGAMRTYARLQAGEMLSYRAWIEAVRAGRTFVTNGPLLSFTVNGEGPSADLDLASSAKPLRVHAEARSIVPFERLELLVGGPLADGHQYIATAPASGNPATAVLDTELPVAGGGWLAVHCRSHHLLPHEPGAQRVFALSSPVYVRVAGKEPQADASALKSLMEHLDEMLQWVQHGARCSTEKHRADLANVFTAARDELLRRMG
jgi:hypothetical protein